MSILRVDKLLSETTDFSRSEIKHAVRTGALTVNGALVKQPETKVDTEKDCVVFLGKEIKYKKYIYLLLNKPAGILSASNDAKRKTVIDLLPEEYKHYNLFPVGRLDKDTTGLLLITNDGDFSHKIISPKSNIEKEYIVSVDAEIPENISVKFKEGIVLADGTLCKPALAKALDKQTVQIIITEGKYHQIKRMLGTQGLGVVSLHRRRIGQLVLTDAIKSGEICELSVNDIKQISPNLP